jgi:hypothetical protein
VNIQPVENGYVVSYHGEHTRKVYYPTLDSVLLAIRATFAGPVRFERPIGVAA